MRYLFSFLCAFINDFLFCLRLVGGFFLPKEEATVGFDIGQYIILIEPEMHNFLTVVNVLGDVQHFVYSLHCFFLGSLMVDQFFLFLNLLLEN